MMLMMLMMLVLNGKRERPTIQQRKILNPLAAANHCTLRPVSTIERGAI